MRKWLEAARGARYVGVAELAQEAARILSESGGAQQARGTVTELPDERTVRFYLSEGLVPPAEEKQGTASVFGYRHLLRLLVVKKLQAEHLPIRAIRDVVGDKTERQLERLLGADEERGGVTAARGEALGYLESILRKGPRASMPAASSPPPPAAQSASPSAAPPRETWARVELEPGLEVHVSDSYRAPQGEGALKRLSQSFLNLLRARGAQLPRRGGK
ncbi:MAG TPA: MerR family transcriptional regulator [Pyrinomonadaceae bacterium]